METEEVITLQFVRCDGRLERAKQGHHSLQQARDLAERVFELGGDLYSEVEIQRSGGQRETIKNHPGERRDAHRID